jgi:flagellar FliL protein
MATPIPTLEAAPGQHGAAPPKQGKLVIILLMLVVLLLSGGGVAGYFLLTQQKSTPAAAAEKPADVAKTPPVYVALDPPFVVNFEAEQLVRFLQVSVQVMSYDPATAELIKANDPVVRNDLLMLLGNQNYATISSRDGKEKLRQQALDAVRKVVANAGGKPNKVEAVYFTSFVMQ